MAAMDGHATSKTKEVKKETGLALRYKKVRGEKLNF